MQEIPKRWMDYFPPPKKVCQSEYSAMYNCIADAMADTLEEEQIGLIRAILREFLEWAEALLYDLPDGGEGQ